MSYIGKDVLPDSDKLETKYIEFDHLKAVTVPATNHIKSNNRDYALIGSINFGDEYGHTKADFITQVRLSVANPSFGTNPIVDSVIFYLAYTAETYYGDTNTALNFKAYEINQDIYLDSTYYSDYDVSTIIDETTELCNQLVYPSPQGEKLELILDNLIGEKVINADPLQLADNDVFVEYLKGIYLTTDSVNNGGAILYFGLTSDASFIRIFYHNDEDTLSYDLLINKYCAEIGMFHNTGHNINFNDTTSEFIYTQPLAGVMGKVDLSPVKIFADSERITINKAELVFDYFEQTYPQPDKLFLQVNDGKQDTITIVKDIIQGYYDGNYDEENNQYKFVITKHITDIISGEQQYTELLVYPNKFTLTANRATLINNFDNKNIKLKIIYTKY